MLRTHGRAHGSRIARIVVLYLVTAAFSPTTVLEAAPPAETGHDQGARIEAVGRLINNSSGSAQITSSGEEAAVVKHKAAKETYERAVQAHRNGDEATAKRLLDEASRTMFEAVRLAKPDAVVGDKKRAEFTKRLDSLNQMLAAYNRIRKEKNSDAGIHEVNGALHEKLDRANSLFDAGRLDEARVALDDAYGHAKLAMEKLHGGDTVVRSLKFSSKEEEYRYELDRNTTHQILLTGLLDEKTDRPELKTQVQPFVDRASELRQQAESAGGAGDYAKGIEILEQSTAELIRAIRAAGVFIPG